MTGDNNQETKALIAALIGHTFWGFSFMASRVGLDVAHMFVLLSHRFLIAFFLMFLMAAFHVVKFNIKGKRILPLLFLGLMEPIVYFIGEQYGILHSNTIFSGVMIAMIPIACTLSAGPLLNEYPTKLQLVFSALSVAGVIGVGLLSRGSGVLEFGGLVALIVAVLAAVIYTLSSRKVSNEYSAFERTFIMMLCGAVFFTSLAVFHVKGNFTEYIKPLSNTNYLLAILFLGVFCSVGSYFLNAYALTYITVARETVFANLTTAVSVFAGAIFLNEPFSLLGLLFCAMILIGIYGVQMAARKQQQAVEESPEDFY